MSFFRLLILASLGLVAIACTNQEGCEATDFSLTASPKGSKKGCGAFKETRDCLNHSDGRGHRCVWVGAQCVENCEQIVGRAGCMGPNCVFLSHANGVDEKCFFANETSKNCREFDATRCGFFPEKCQVQGNGCVDILKSGDARERFLRSLQANANQEVLDEAEEDEARAEGFSDFYQNISLSDENQKRDIFGDARVLDKLFPEAEVAKKPSRSQLLAQIEALKGMSNEQVQQRVKAGHLKNFLREEEGGLKRESVRAFIKLCREKGLDVLALFGDDLVARQAAQKVLQQIEVEQILAMPNQVKKAEKLLAFNEEAIKAAIDIIFQNLFDPDRQSWLKQLYGAASPGNKIKIRDLVYQKLYAKKNRLWGRTRHRRDMFRVLSEVIPIPADEHGAFAQEIQRDRQNLLFDDALLKKDEAQIRTFVQNLPPAKIPALLSYISEEAYSDENRQAFKALRSKEATQEKKRELRNLLLKQANDIGNLGDIIAHADGLGISKTELLEETFGASRHQRIDEYMADAILQKIPEAGEGKKEVLRELGRAFESLGRTLFGVEAQTYAPEHTDRDAFRAYLSKSVKDKVAGEASGTNSAETRAILGLSDGHDVSQQIINLFLSAHLSPEIYQEKIGKIYKYFMSLSDRAKVSLFLIYSDQAQFWTYGYDQAERLLFMPAANETADMVRDALEAQKNTKSYKIGRVMDFGGYVVASAGQKGLSPKEWVNKTVYNTSQSPMQVVLASQKRPAHIPDDPEALREFVEVFLQYGADPFRVDGQGFTVFDGPYRDKSRLALDIFVKQLGHKKAQLELLKSKIGPMTPREKLLWFEGAISGYSGEALSLIESPVDAAHYLKARKSESLAESLDSLLQKWMKVGESGQEILTQRYLGFLLKLFEFWGEDQVFDDQFVFEHGRGTIIWQMVNIISSQLSNNPSAKDKLATLIQVLAYGLKELAKSKNENWNRFIETGRGTDQALETILMSHFGIDSETAKAWLQVTR